MNYFKKKYKYIKDCLSSSYFTTTLFLLVIIVFLFNLNFNIFSTEATPVDIVGEGHVGYIPKWVFNTSVSCYEVRADTTATVTASSTSIYTGGSATITWSSESATTCTGTNFNNNGISSGTSAINTSNLTGITVSPNSTTTYTIICQGNPVSTSSVTITVKKRPSFKEN